ncbi:MAG: acyl-CoA dehydrogenase [Deltaproteobacteria bacterium]|nr:acyl-CoA dehydrogenase [Deltaproteobacteria bacterium]
MSTQQHFKSNLRDTFFNLFEVLDVGRTSLGRGPFSALDEATARQTLEAWVTFCENEWAPSFAEADRAGCRLEPDGSVILPAGLRKSLDAYFGAEWHRLELPERLGGYGAPPTVAWAAFEQAAGSHASACFYTLGNNIARVIDRLGTPSQKKRYVQGLCERHWGGAMVLTEADAGSDVGMARTKARHVAGDVWEIEGVKRFITNGDFNGPENIVHLVLARPEGAAVGTKGLSMFIVPKYWVEEDGSLGPRNGMRCTNIEKKMGIKASATCEMTYGDSAPCRGLLVGEAHDGIRQMFQVIEYARMAVGVKSMATLSTAYLNALAYTKDRVQGADLLRANDKSAPRVRIIEHPDVRRMLLLQKSHAEGMRALCLYTAWIQDQVELGGGHGAEDAEALDRRNDLLLPLVKGYCSEKSYELLSVALQCFGGSGYCQDYPMEQYIRDQRIDSLYEGTTHIQALDLIFRKVARDGGATLRALLAEVKATLESPRGGAALAAEREALGRALGDLEAIFGTMLGKMGESLYHVGAVANRILFALAEVLIGWLLFRQAQIALEKVETAAGPEQAFYRGKIASARYFAKEILPGIGLCRRWVERSDLALMELDEEAF